MSTIEKDDPKKIQENKDLSKNQIKYALKMRAERLRKTADTINEYLNSDIPFEDIVSVCDAEMIGMVQYMIDNRDIVRSRRKLAFWQGKDNDEGWKSM